MPYPGFPSLLSASEASFQLDLFREASPQRYWTLRQSRRYSMTDRSWARELGEPYESQTRGESFFPLRSLPELPWLLSRMLGREIRAPVSRRDRSPSIGPQGP